MKKASTRDALTIEQYMLCFISNTCYKQRQAELGKKLSKSSAITWSWTFAIWKLFTFILQHFFEFHLTILSKFKEITSLLFFLESSRSLRAFETNGIILEAKFRGDPLGLLNILWCISKESFKISLKTLLYFVTRNLINSNIRFQTLTTLQGLR